MTKERLIALLSCLLALSLGLEASWYELEVVEGPTATDNWVPLVLNQEGALAGNAYFFEENGSSSLPIWWPNPKEPTLVSTPRGQSARVKGMSTDQHLLCEMGFYGSERWQLWDVTLGWQPLALPEGLTCHIEGLESSGVAFGTYRKRHHSAVEGALLFPQAQEAELIELRHMLKRQGLSGIIHSVVLGGDDTLIVNYTHPSSLNEDFLLWHPSREEAVQPAPSDLPRIVLSSNSNACVCGCEYLEDWDNQCRHFYWSPNEGFIYLEPDLAPGIPDNPALTVFQISAAGQVVGAMKSKGGINSRHAFVWDSQHGLQDLNQLLSTEVSHDILLQAAVAINQNGDILVRGSHRITQARVYCLLHRQAEASPQ